MAVEINDLPNDSTIDGAEKLVVVDTADNNLGKTITTEALKDHIIDCIPDPTLAELGITADATEINQLDDLTLGNIVTCDKDDFATGAEGDLATSALQQSDVSVTGQTLTIGTQDYTPDTQTDAEVNALIDARVNSTFINALTIDADTVGGNQVLTPVPAGAVFTDTNTQLSDADVKAIIDNTYINSLTIDADTVSGFTVGVNVPADANFYGTTVIANPGGSGDPLTTVSIAGTVYSVTGGGSAQLLSSITPSNTTLSGASQVVAFTITGEPGAVVNLTVENATPAGFVQTTDLTATQITLNSGGTGGTTITVPALAVGTRTFQVQAVAVGGGQLPFISDVISQTGAAFITSVVVDNITFNRFGATEDVTITGSPNLAFTLDLVTVTPTGWITSGALAAQSGTLNASGVFTTTITIPTDSDDTFTRTFAIRATGTGSDSSATATSVLITQSHTQTTAAGDLSISADYTYSSPNLTFNAEVLTGDPPFTLVLNQHPTDATISPIQTLSLSATGMTTFTTLNVASIPDGGVNYYIHASDADGDVVVETELVTLVNNPPAGSIALTTGSTTPVDTESLEFTATFTDVESDPFTYQWQHIPTNGFNIDERFLIDSDVGSNLGSLTNVQAYNQLGGGGGIFVIAVNSSSTHTVTFTESDGTELTFTGVGGVADSHGSTGGFREFVVISDGVQRAAVQATADGTLGNGAFYWNTDSIKITETGVDWADVAGETSATYDLTASTTTVNDINSARNLINLTKSDLRDSYAVLSGGIAVTTPRDSFWGADTDDLTVNSVLGVWEDGADHSTTAPEVVVFSSDDAVARTFTWSTTGVESYRSSNATGGSIALGVLAADEASNGFDNDFWFNDSQIEIWTGNQYTTVATPTRTTVDQGGGYRCIVTATTGNTTPVVSNVIEIVRG